MKKNNVIILGSIPPPVGGVTIHTVRLVSHLNLQGFKNEFIDLRPRKKNGKICIKKYIFNIFRFIFLCRKSIVHYQLNNWTEIVFLTTIQLIFKFRFITTVHSFRPEIFNTQQNICFRYAKTRKIKFIAPSETIKQLLMISGIEKSKIQVIDPFLPPSEEELKANLPNQITDFIKRNNKVLLANASKLYLDNKKIDVYGLDMCIEACKEIGEISLIFCVPVIQDEKYYKECLEKICKYSIENRILIVNENISLVALFKYVDIFVRPTSTDSYGISVQEAISNGVPAIASDICKRAEGTILFNTRDQDDFLNKIRDNIDAKNSYQVITNKDNAIKKYIELYKTN